MTQGKLQAKKAVAFDLQALIDPKQETILWIGAGASIPAGHPSTAKLLDELRAEAAPDGGLPEGLDFTATVDAFLELVGEGTLADVLQRVFGEARQPTSVHRALARLVKAGCFKTIVTTNYDDLFERALAEEGVPYLLQVKEDNLHVLNQGGVRLLKPHGDRGNWNKTVLSGKSYREFEADHSKLVPHLDELLRKHPVFFVGYSMTDPRTVGWLNELPSEERNKLKRWRPMLTETDWKWAQKEAKGALGISSIKALLVENYVEHLPRLIQELADHFDPPTGKAFFLTLTAGKEGWEVELPGFQSWTLTDPAPSDSDLAKAIVQFREWGHRALPTDENGHLTAEGATGAGALRRLAENIGDRLTEALFPEEVRKALISELQQALNSEPVLLTIRVRAAGGDEDADRLADHALALPWELLRFENQFPLETGTLDLMREAFVPNLDGLREPTASLKVVATVAAPEDATALDYERECLRLWQALGEDHRRFEMTDRGTLEDFLEKIEEHQPPVVHFTGHGKPGHLLFENEFAFKKEVAIETLVSRLRFGENHQLPRLIYLASCHGATAGQAAPIGEAGFRAPKVDIPATDQTQPSTAASLHRAGFPQVVAYFGPVGDEQSTRIEEAFYSALGAGLSTRKALRAARAVSTKVHSNARDEATHVYPLGWSQVVFYHRGKDVPAALVSQEKSEKEENRESDDNSKQPQFGFVGRRSRRAELLRRWGKEGQRLTVVAGLGGLGKTALCTNVLPIFARYLAQNGEPGVPILTLNGRAAKDSEKPIEVLWDQLETFVPSNAEGVAKAWPEIRGKIQQDRGLSGVGLATAVFVAAKLGNGLLLYLDDAESLQWAPGEGELGQWRCPEVSDFWTQLCELIETGSKAAQPEGEPNPPIGVLASARYVPEGLSESKVLHLDPMRGVDLRRMITWRKHLRLLPRRDREWLAERVDGHPRTIEFLEGLIRNRLEHQLVKQKGPGFDRSKLDWRKEVLDPVLEGVQEKLDADLLLPRLWESLTAEEQEHLGRCLAILNPLPWEAAGALGSGETLHSLVRSGLISPAPSPNPKEPWWMLQRLVSECVAELWSGDLQQAHFDLGHYFAGEFANNKLVFNAMQAVDYLCEAKEGNEAWPIARILLGYLRSEGRYTEALRWCGKPFAGEIAGPAKGLALAWHSQLSILAGASTEGLEEYLLEAIKLVDPTDRRIVLSELGRLMERLGRLPEAAQFKTEALQENKDRLGPEHPDTLTSMNNLAQTLQSQGDLSGARQLQEEVLSVRQRVLGPEHPDTLITMYNLFHTLLQVGEPEKAIPLFVDALKIARRTLPERAPVRAALEQLAAQFQKQAQEKTDE
ncbi:MAG: CHAT domain-containing protein [Planctomycetota bacterium]|nr:MAG: CHAT domain-containing protein [Planctomycetota bacterium]